MMSVLLLSAGDGGDGLKRIIQALVPREKLEVYGSVKSFSVRLRKPTDDIPVAVVVAGNEDELLGILSISHLLHDVRFILVLPDREDVTIAIGHSLRPRFLSYIDSDYRDVTAVLGKMIGGFYWERRNRNLGNSGRLAPVSYLPPSYRKVVS